MTATPRPKPASLQFGEPQSGLKYRDRPAAFGVAEHHGQIALICVTREGQAPFHDLPGGGIEPGESDARALAREFVEETGLVVAAGEVLTHADQYMVRKDGEAVNNRCVLMIARIEGFDPGQKIEEDHRLVWLDPQEALRILRLDSQAWAVACWLRRREREARERAA
jgi:8-oxo-dGTP diphosphatase